VLADGPEIHFQQPPLAGHEQVAAPRFERDGRRGVAQDIENDMRCRQSCVAAQIDLLQRREPTKVKAFFRGHKKSRLGQIVFLCDSLQQAVVQPTVERAYGSRVAFEGAGGEGIHLVLPDLHEGQASVFFRSTFNRLSKSGASRY
jgi:hypothetical protein